MIAIFHLQRGMPSKRKSSACIDYVPALCTHRPSLLPIEWSDENYGLSVWAAFVAYASREVVWTLSFRGRRSRNKVSVGEPAEGSLTSFHTWLYVLCFQTTLRTCWMSKKVDWLVRADCFCSLVSSLAVFGFTLLSLEFFSSLETSVACFFYSSSIALIVTDWINQLPFVKLNWLTTNNF